MAIWWRAHCGLACLFIWLDCYLPCLANPNYCLWTNTRGTHLSNNITRIEILLHCTGSYIKLFCGSIKAMEWFELIKLHRCELPTGYFCMGYRDTIVISAKFVVHSFHSFHWYPGPYKHRIRCFIIISRKTSNLRDWVSKSMDSMQNWVYLAPVNLLRPSDAYMRRWTGSSLVQIMALRLFGTKPLSEPMLEYCWLDL